MSLFCTALVCPGPLLWWKGDTWWWSGLTPGWAAPATLPPTLFLPSRDNFVLTTLSCDGKFLSYLPYQANGYSSLAHVSVILWPASLLMSYVGSSDKFRAIVCGLAIRPLMLPRYPHCELPRPPISLLSTEETKSAPGNIFFQSIKSRILCGIISYCALMASS